MQRIEATLDPDYLDETMKAVLSLRVPCQITASEVRYADGLVEHSCQYRGVRYEVAWETRARLEVVVSDREAKSVIGLLGRARYRVRTTSSSSRRSMTPCASARVQREFAF